MLLYPNPLINGILNVDVNQLREKGVLRIEIFNASGRLVHEINISGEAVNEISLMNGIYIAKIFGVDYRENQKLVVR